MVQQFKEKEGPSKAKEDEKGVLFTSRFCGYSFKLPVQRPTKQFTAATLRSGSRVLGKEGKTRTEHTTVGMC